jgi:hypothetical protein
MFQPREPADRRRAPPLGRAEGKRSGAPCRHAAVRVGRKVSNFIATELADDQKPPILRA